MVQGNNTSSKQTVVTLNRRKNPSQQAELAAKTSPRQTRRKTPTSSRYEGGVKNALETSETLIAAKKSSKKTHKNAKKGENSNGKDTLTLKNVKDSNAKENVIPEDRINSMMKLKLGKDVRKASIGSHDSVGYRPLRPFSGHSDRLVRPGSEDSVSSSMRQERERLSSRKDSSFSTYIEITHNASEDLIVVENADSDWSDSVEITPEVENVVHRKTAKQEVVKLPEEKEVKPRWKRRTRTKKKRNEAGRVRSKSANDKDEVDDRANHVILTDLEQTTQEIPAEPIYVPHDIWEPKQRERKKGKQTMVRVGGGFMDLPYYLHYHVPIKVYQPKPYSQLFNKHMFMVKSKRPESATDHKQYGRPSWTNMNKGFKAFACI